MAAAVLATVGITSALLRYALPPDVHVQVTTPLYGSYAAEQLPVLAQHPRDEAAHRLGGAALLALGLLQFSSRVRRQWPRLHRWAGRTFLALAAVSALSGAVLALRAPYDTGERAPSLVFGGFLVFAGARALGAIRRGDVDAHRAWMVRCFAAALGIGTIRLFAVALITLTPWTAKQVISPTFWAGWIVTLAVAEAWLWRERRAPETERGADGLRRAS